MHKDPDDHLGYSEVPDRLRRTPHFPPPNKSAQPVEHRDFTLRAGEQQREEGYAASDAAAKIYLVACAIAPAAVPAMSLH